MVLGQTAHFRLLSLRNYYAKWCSDRPIAQRVLAQRPHDSGQFRGLLDEEMLGTGLYQRTNRPTVANAALRANLGRIRAHRLRHTAATQILRAGASLREIGQLLRHRCALTTAIYAKADREALRTIARSWPGDVP